MLGYRKGGAGYVLIKITGNLTNNTSGVLGLDGKPLQIDDTFERQKRARIEGQVIQLPFYMGNSPISQIPVGYPAYGAIREINDADIDDSMPELYSSLGGQYEYKMMSDIAQEIKIGDKVYFKWRVTHNHKNLLAQSVGVPGKPPTWIFRAQYDNLYCVVRDGKMIMIGSHVLIDPIFETWDEILRPTYYDIKDKDGNPMVRPKKEWLVMKSAPGKKDRQGIVVEVGTPLRGEKCLIDKGDKILFKPNMRNLIKIEGKDYFVLRQDQIVCKVIEEAA